jgi:hypothetical protein
VAVAAVEKSIVVEVALVDLELALDWRCLLAALTP